MFKKVFLTSIISTILFLSVTFLTTNANAVDHIIKAVYFVPKNRPSQKHIPPKLSDPIKQTQEFYADQMEFHGYGRMTFEYEKDANNNPVIHQVIGKFDDAYYHHNTIVKVETEIKQRFHDVDDNIYIISIDVSNGLIGGYCGKAQYEGGPVCIPTTGKCVSEDNVVNLIAHELGHALNLRHDFRDVKYIMAWGGPQCTQFSECSAMLLSVSPFLNKAHNHENERGHIEMLSPNIYTINYRKHKLKFQVSDPDGINQVILEYSTPDRMAGIDSCQSISNKLRSEIIFDMPDDAINATTAKIWLHVVDRNGYLTTKEYQLIGTEKKDLLFTYLTLEYDNPNALTPINPPKEWGWNWNWNGWQHTWEKEPDGEIPQMPHQGFQKPEHIRFIDKWDHWFYAHAEGRFIYDLTLTEIDHKVFGADFYLPNPCENVASVEMICSADKVEIYKSGVIRWAQAQNKHITFDIPDNTKEFIIKITDAGDDITCDHYIIANAKLLAPEPRSVEAKSKLVLTWANLKKSQ